MKLNMNWCLTMQKTISQTKELGYKKNTYCMQLLSRLYSNKRYKIDATKQGLFLTELKLLKQDVFKSRSGWARKFLSSGTGVFLGTVDREKKRVG